MRAAAKYGAVLGAIFALLSLPGCAAHVLQPQATAAQPLCVIEPSAMPASWRPFGQVQRRLSSAPWSAQETADAAAAVRRGLDEMTQFYFDHPAAVEELRQNAVESLIDTSYSASNMPDVRTKARDEARRVLTPLMAPYLDLPAQASTCNEYVALLDYTVYAHQLLLEGDVRMPEMVARTNSALRACGTFERALGLDYKAKLNSDRLSIDDAFQLTMWAIVFTGAQTVPGLDVPADARALPPSLWRVLARFPMPAAKSFPEGAKNRTFYDTAYLVTHMAYVPTGYGRHAIAISDSPAIYRFLRENFYAVLELGELDLASEFVDLFRQYGCTENNDLQLRDGTRFLMGLFHSAGDHWMAYHPPNTKPYTDSYDLVHEAWTGISGVRARVPEPNAPGTYGAVVRQWLR